MELSSLCHPERSRGISMEILTKLNRDPSTSLRFAQDDTRIIQLRVRKPRFSESAPNLPHTCGSISERVNAARSYNGVP